jgi:hypothetical protein
MWREIILIIRTKLIKIHLNVDCVAFLYKRAVPIFEQVHSNNVIKLYLVRSRAINFGRQCHFKIWLNCHKFKKCPCLIMPISTRCQKHEKKNDNYCHTVGFKKKREMKFDLMWIGNLICQFMSICACLTVVFLTHKCSFFNLNSKRPFQTTGCFRSWGVPFNTW